MFDKPYLSVRELNVLNLLKEGHTRRQIALDLEVSVGTIKMDCHIIYGKLNAHSELQSVIKALRLNLISLNHARPER